MMLYHWELVDGNGALKHEPLRLTVNPLVAGQRALAPPQT